MKNKPWACPEFEYVDHAIEVQDHFGQEGNNNTWWDTAVDPT